MKKGSSATDREQSHRNRPIRERPPWQGSETDDRPEQQQQQRFSAAQSHVLNDDYMERFEKGFAELTGRSTGSEDRLQPLSSSSTFGLPECQQSAKSSSAAQPLQRLAKTQLSQGLSKSLLKRPVVSLQAVCGPDPDVWRRPPHNTAGVVWQLSERPLMCSASHPGLGEVVIGGSDHALYIMEAATGKLKRTLFGKTAGHSEWVTCAMYTPEGHVISGGMDSKLCFWRKGSTKSDTLPNGHSGPISALAPLASSSSFLSASYDKTLRLWQSSGSSAVPRCAGELTGHKAYVMQVCTDGACSAASGDRGGALIAWDLQTGSAELHIKDAHAGHVTAMCMGSADTAWDCISGGQDGMLIAWDFRAKAPAWRAAAHVNQAGKGAVGSILDLGSTIASAGADGTVSLWRPQKDPAKPMATCKVPDFPYCLTATQGRKDAAESTLFCGCGNGFILAISEAGGRELYRLKGNGAAVRSLDVVGAFLVAGGDDGSSVTFPF